MRLGRAYKSHKLRFIPPFEPVMTSESMCALAHGRAVRSNVDVDPRIRNRSRLRTLDSDTPKYFQNNPFSLVLDPHAVFEIPLFGRVLIPLEESRCQSTVAPRSYG